ncbi:MAG: DNA integrity scanning diadenylate cyclase DisA [Nanoarchaeota archaeon]
MAPEVQEVLIPKEVQKTITSQNIKKIPEEEFLSILKLVAPGTNLRTALDGALKTGKGALIVIENEFLFPLLDGGFKVNCRFTPQRLIELSKMDGAIILAKDMKRILYANVLLTPDAKIKASETGTRHKAAERTAKQIAGLAIAISERKHEISLFYKSIKYPLKNTDDILRKTSTYIQLIEKEREQFDTLMEKLNKVELRGHSSLNLAVQLIQKGKLIQKIVGELKKNIIEIGSEGTILKTRLKELINGVDKEINLSIKDYTKLNLKRSNLFLNILSYDDLLDINNILRTLGFEAMPRTTNIRGWRILSKTNLQDAEIAELISKLGNLGKILNSDLAVLEEFLDEEKGIFFKEEIDKLKVNV